jgi:hypothetical protein
MTIPVSTAVTINHTTLSGVTTGAVIDDNGNYLVKVQYIDNDGVQQERFFTEDEVAAV